MIFSAALSIGLSSFFLGSAFGCALCIVFAKLFGKRFLKCRVSLMLFFSAFAVCSAAAFAVFVQGRFSFSSAFSSSDNVVFFAGLFSLGTVVSSLWKFALAPALIAFVAVSVHTSKLIDSRFPSFSLQSPLSVPSDSACVRIRVYKIPPKLLLPVGRFFYEVEVDGDDDGGGSAAVAAEEKKSGFSSWIFGDVEEIRLELPSAKVYPALFMLKFERGLDDFSYSVSRTL